MVVPWETHLGQAFSGGESICVFILQIVSFSYVMIYPMMRSWNFVAYREVDNRSVP